MDLASVLVEADGAAARDALGIGADVPVKDVELLRSPLAGEPGRELGVGETTEFSARSSLGSDAGVRQLVFLWFWALRLTRSFKLPER